MKFYFDTIKYPFDGDFKTSTATWAKLREDLFRRAAENGFHLSANGTKHAFARYIYCTRFRKMTPSTSSATPSDYRQSFIKSDRRSGSRPDGLTGALPRSSTRANEEDLRV
jgi:hypothetical protein